MASVDKRVIIALKRMEDVLSQFSQSSHSWLSQEEQARYGSLTSCKRRQQFLCGRFLARQAISHLCGGPWHVYFLSAPDEGAPRVIGPSEPVKLNSLSISISHTEGWVACAVSAHQIGVDVQSRQKPRDIVGLSQMIDCDLSIEIGLSAMMRNRLFYAHWGLREAWIKQSDAMPGAAIPRFVPKHAADDGVGGLVSDIGDATLAVYPAMPQAIEMTRGSFRISDWAYWHPMRETPSSL